MNYLSLFSGANGGDLAFQHLLKGFRCVGYIDHEPYCQAITRQRISDGLLDNAPIFSCIKEFISQGWAKEYQGMVELVIGGFPCQPFSVAGKRKGEQDERNMWPWTIAAIRLVRPRYAFLENVPGLLASGYMPRIFADLAEAGYHARWTVLGADDVGANHKRKRLWILAYTTKPNDRICNPESINRQIQQPGKCNSKKDVANPTKQRLPESTCRELEGLQQQKKSSQGREFSRGVPTQGGNWATEPSVG